LVAGAQLSSDCGQRFRANLRSRLAIGPPVQQLL
jgi:hypothetical protein